MRSTSRLQELNNVTSGSIGLPRHYWNQRRHNHYGGLMVCVRSSSTLEPTSLQSETARFVHKCVGDFEYDLNERRRDWLEQSYRHLGLTRACAL